MICVVRNPYRSIVVEHDGDGVVISEGNSIKFNLESGKLIKGVVTKLSGKDEKLKIQIRPEGKDEHEQIWSVAVMEEGSLTLDR